MQPFSLFSEEYTPHGNVAAEGILNQLGRPGLDLLTLLIRETVQNSRDARLSEKETVQFTVEGRTLTVQQLDFLRNVVLVTPPGNLRLQETFSSSASDGLQILVISDRGTTGLNGPIRANTPDDSSGSRNFVNFFFNTGQSKGQQFSGGTYGYGKSILYRVSQVHTICVYTRCQANGMLESRFMAAALDPHDQEKQAGYRRYTGRSWWGRLNSNDGVLEPVIGQEADQIARELGLPPFMENEQGTTCMILCPVLGNFSLEEAMLRVSRSLLWYAWPAMIAPPNGISAMHFTVLCKGQEIPMPDPATYPPLNGFVDAMHLLQENQQDTQDYMWQITTLASQRPKQRLGRLVLLRFPFEERERLDAQPSDDLSGMVFPIPGTAHHVALMRNTDLVIKYLEGGTLPGSRFEYAGIFVAEREIDEAFAKAEPPTHDDWNPQTITDRQEKTYVNVALREIKKTMADFIAPLPVASMGGKVVPLGTFADRLASFLIGVKGTAASDLSSTERHLKSVPGLRPADSSALSRPGVHPLQPVPSSQKNDEKPASQIFDVPAGLFGPETKTWDNINGSESTSSHDPLADPSTKERGANATSPSGPRRPAEIVLQHEGRLELLGDIPVLMTTFRVEHAPGSQTSTVEVKTSVVLDKGDKEEKPPANEMQPEVLLWITSDGKERSGSEMIHISSTDTGFWKVAVSIPEDAFVQVSLIASEVFQV
jgi:hypothetical protein